MFTAAPTFTSDSVLGEHQHFPFTWWVIQLCLPWIRPKKNQTILHPWCTSEAHCNLPMYMCLNTCQYHFVSQGTWISKTWGYEERQWGLWGYMEPQTWHDKHCPECSVAAMHSSVDLLFRTIFLCFSLPLPWLCTRQVVLWLSEFMAQISVTINKWFRKLHQIPPPSMVGGF